MPRDGQVRTTVVAGLMATYGWRWWGHGCGHEGWQPTCPPVCPKCGNRIAETRYRQPTPAQFAKWTKESKR